MKYNGDIIYGGAKGKPITRLQNVQKRILRICIYTQEYIEAEQLFVLGKTSKLEIRREVHLNLFIVQPDLG